MEITCDTKGEDKMDEIINNLQRFANAHGIVLTKHGECGFGRPCVGYLHGDNYVDYAPIDLTTDKPVFPNDNTIYVPDTVIDAYHKHSCLAVLVHNDDYDEALRQLNEWVKYLESLGEVEIVDYETGATGIQAFITGILGKAIRIKEKTNV